MHVYKGTNRGRKAEAEAAAVAEPVVRVCRCCRKRRTRRHRWPGSMAVAARKTRCCTEHRGGDGGDGAGDATVAAVAAVDDDQRPTNRVAACWTARSGARTTDVEPLAVAAAAMAPVSKTRAVAKPSVIVK